MPSWQGRGLKQIGTVDEVRAAFLDNSVTRIPKATIKEWMLNSDLQVQGALNWAISEFSRSKRVQPYLTFEDYYGFVVPYLLRCMQEDPQIEYCENRHLAGYALSTWFNSWWKDKGVPRKKLDELKSRLADFYKTSETDVRDAVITSVLEQLIKNREIKEYFSDWQNDSVLAGAFRDAQV